MFKKLLLGGLLGLTAFTGLSSAAQADPRRDYRDRDYRDTRRDGRNDTSRYSYGRSDRYYGNSGYYGGNYGYGNYGGYGYGRNDYPRYSNGYYDRGYGYGYSRDNSGKVITGAIIGGILGGILAR